MDINSVFTVFRRRQSFSVRGWGRVQVLPRSPRSAFDSRPYILRFCAVNCTTRHLVSSDLNKSCRPGLLVLVSYIKSMCNSCTHLSYIQRCIIVRVKYIILFLKHGTRARS